MTLSLGLLSMRGLGFREQRPSRSVMVFAVDDKTYKALGFAGPTGFRVWGLGFLSGFRS